MVENASTIDSVFQALAHPARRGILARLADRDLSVGELAQPLDMSLAAASKHVKVLERAGLVSQTATGRQHICRLEPVPLGAAFNWLRFYERFWDEKLDALQALFEGEPPTTTEQE